MKRLSKFVASHPVEGMPYDMLRYVKLNGQRRPLYGVEGCGGDPAGAPEALNRAFKKYGGQCFYCSTPLTAQKLSKDGAHRDHVIAQSRDGCDLLHNLVIACGKCGSEKGSKPIEDFKPGAAGKYLEALNRHLAICVGRNFPPGD